MNNHYYQTGDRVRAKYVEENAPDYNATGTIIGPRNDKHTYPVKLDHPINWGYANIDDYVRYKDYEIEHLQAHETTTQTPTQDHGSTWTRYIETYTAEQDTAKNFAKQVRIVTDEIGDLLITKNRAYGDSALNPIRIFSTANNTEALRVRIDDKLSRLKRGTDAGEDTITDLIGYLILLKIAEDQ